MPWGIAPLGNDAFYHAARILAVAADPSSIHEFDALLQWPDGVWLVWPWAYDYLIGAVAGLLAVGDESVMRVAVFTPLAWLAASLTLVALAVRRVLEPSLLALYLVVFAANPMSLGLHAVGAIDHHAAELFWALAALLILVRWLDRPASRATAAGLGMVLGCASAFHNSLFILQIPVLLTLFITRFRYQRVLPKPAASWFGAGLLGAQLLVLSPSVHFRELSYAFYHLSWFHMHAALLTALAVFSFALRNGRHSVLLLLVAVLGALPASGQLMHGAQFISTGLPLMGDMIEAKSPYLVQRSVTDVTLFYTALIWLAPLILAYGVYRLWKLRDSTAELPLLVFSVAGITMLMFQVRFFQLGMPFLFLLPILFFQSLGLDRRRRFTYATLFMLVAFVISFSYYSHLGPPGLSVRWASGWPLLKGLEEPCRTRPGLLLTNQNWGNLARYHTKCPLIANNFIMTPKDERAIRRSHELLGLAPGRLLEAEPAVRYVLVSSFDDSVLTRHLLSERSYPGYELLDESRNARGELLARSFRVTPAGGP